MKRFKDKVCLITGADNEIGGAAAAAFAAEGARIMLTGADMEILAKTVESINSNGGEAGFIPPFKPTREEVMKAFDETIEKLGRPGILINCVFIRIDNATIDNVLEKIEQTSASSIGTFSRFCRQALYYMKENEPGVIINIGPGRGGQDTSGQMGELESVASGALFSLTRKIAVEYASSDIRVNGIAAGAIKTDRYRKLRERREPDFEKKILRKIPLHRMGKPGEIASAALFLASDEASYITGQVLQVDGGYTIS